MIVLDTNVLAEILRPAPDAKVLAWLEAKPVTAVFTTSITQGELLYGVRLLPEGRRKEGLLDAVLAIFASDMAGRVLSSIAMLPMPMRRSRRRGGSPVSPSASSMP